MFKKMFGKKEVSIVAPLNGELVPLEEVPDPVFNQKMMGDGIAIKPADGKVCAPADGKIIQIPETKHAIGLRTADGVEILIHIGLETVSLKGEGFTVKTEVGKQVTAGDALLEFDLEYVRENASDTVTPIVITNGKESGKHFSISEEKECQAGETVIISYK
ncbi:PTS sugar transporter subunit IIA [Virgibacillus siamensis]|uniref:PTS sugar transporter subunit IIA n=1 Tax=Virgibacillus siamensis TaxID=480071 RepID=UPI0009861DE9|nr:PTS glucose transporter subunit IIA [Virgibacillus siamensis]